MTFDDLYSYSTKNGVVIPETDKIKESVEKVFKTAFGEGFSVEPETPQGRIIEAITLMFMDVLRVCAVNANGFNPYQAVGAYLDNLGAMFGVSRMPNESDSSYRKSIINASSNGSGYAAALRSALSRIDGVTSVCVLDNGSPDPAILPADEPQGVRVEAHSVLICVGGEYASSDVANAIFDNVPAGCGMLNIAPKDQTISQAITRDGVSKTIVFYKPDPISTSISVSVRDTMYTGVDIVNDTKQIISSFINGNITNRHFTKEDIASAIASAGTGIVCSNVTIEVAGVSVDRVNVSPLQSISISVDSITVEVI